VNSDESSFLGGRRHAFSVPDDDNGRGARLFAQKSEGRRPLHGLCGGRDERGGGFQHAAARDAAKGGRLADGDALRSARR